VKRSKEREMMTTPAAFDAYLQGTIRIADANMRGTLTSQGLTTVDDFATLREADIDQLCAAVRRPSGMANPNYDPNNPATGVQQNILVANPGFPIGVILVRRLKLLRYYIYHLSRTQRVFVDQEADIARLSDVYRLKEVEDEEVDVPFPEKLVTIDKVRRTIESIDAYLMQKLGASYLWRMLLGYSRLSCPRTRMLHLVCQHIMKI
jgi:hypothetical protein